MLTPGVDINRGAYRERQTEGLRERPFPYCTVRRNDLMVLFKCRFWFRFGVEPEIFHVSRTLRCCCWSENLTLRSWGCEDKETTIGSGGGREACRKKASGKVERWPGWYSLASVMGDVMVKMPPSVERSRWRGLEKIRSRGNHWWPLRG